MPTILRTENLSKTYKEVTALNNLNIQIEEGELLGLLGVNGAGKTTTIKILTGLLLPSSGNAYIYDKNVIDDIDYIKKITNSSPQETAIAFNLTVKENLEFIASIYGVSKEETKERIKDISSTLHLDEVLNKRAKTLSGGWQRRLSIALGLITNPKILFLDEPTLGLDVIVRRELWNLIKKLKKKMTIVLTSHYLEEIEALCDKVAILANGELKAMGTVDELVKQSKKKNFEDAFIYFAANIEDEEEGEQ